METYPRFVVVSGLIGAGKTTLAGDLGKLLGYETLFEPVEENPYLADFYKDPARWAYPMQEFLKHRRFALYQFAAWGIRCGKFKGVILDRSIHEDTVFAEINRDLGTIHPRDFDTYLQGFQDFSIFLPEPDVYVFLDAPPETCRLRAMNRGREAESTTGFGDEEGIPLSYMKRLHAGYMKWLDEIAPRIPVARVKWTEFQDAATVWEDVKKRVAERSRFTRGLVV